MRRLWRREKRKRYLGTPQTPAGRTLHPLGKGVALKLMPMGAYRCAPAISKTRLDGKERTTERQGHMSAISNICKSTAVLYGLDKLGRARRAICSSGSSALM